MYIVLYRNKKSDKDDGSVSIYGATLTQKDADEMVDLLKDKYRRTDFFYLSTNEYTRLQQCTTVINELETVIKL